MYIYAANKCAHGKEPSTTTPTYVNVSKFRRANIHTATLSSPPRTLVTTWLVPYLLLLRVLQTPVSSETRYVLIRALTRSCPGARMPLYSITNAYKFSQRMPLSWVTDGRKHCNVWYFSVLFYNTPGSEGVGLPIVTANDLLSSPCEG